MKRETRETKYIERKGKKVGVDEFGNKYYHEIRAGGNFKRRWVIYRGIVEPSKVPAEWHAWLHYSTDKPGNKRGVLKYSWQKIHIPNLTGTIYSNIFD